jgi:SagB-type dehydrogenase family enzyme
MSHVLHCEVVVMTPNAQIKKHLCYAASGYLLNRNISTTGFCVDSVLLQNDTVDEPAEMYLVNSHIDKENPELVYSISKYLRYPLTDMTALSGSIVHTGLEKTALKKSYHLDMSLGEIVKQRKSTRKYSGDFIPENSLSALLRTSSGVTHSSTDGNFTRMQRTYPSGGGLYPVKLYVFANKIRKLNRGIYYYDPLQDALFLMENKTDLLDEFLISQQLSDLPNIRDCAFMIFFTIEGWRSISKYGASGLKFAYIELGEIAQNAHLAATCLGLGSCAYASFTPEAVNQLLHVDGDYESFQHGILFGISAED